MNEVFVAVFLSLVTGLAVGFFLGYKYVFKMFSVLKYGPEKFPYNQYYMRAYTRGMKPRDLPDGYALKNIEKDDIQALSDLMEDSFEGATDEWIRTDPEEFIRATIDSEVPYIKFLPESSYCITNGGKAVAAVLISQHPVNRNQETPIIDVLMTSPDHRKRGLATNLISRSMQKLDQLGYNTITLSVSSPNVANKLYQKLGFRYIAPPQKS